jgi:hypothetical protein
MIYIVEKTCKLTDPALLAQKMGKCLNLLFHHCHSSQHSDLKKTCIFPPSPPHPLASSVPALPSDFAGHLLSLLWSGYLLPGSWKRRGFGASVMLGDGRQERSKRRGFGHQSCWVMAGRRGRSAEDLVISHVG